MNDGNRRTNLREQQRVLDRRIAAADHANVLTGEQILVASRGFYHSLSGKLALTGNVEGARPDARCDNDRDQLQVLAATQRDSFRTQIDRLYLRAGPEIESR